MKKAVYTPFTNKPIINKSNINPVQQDKKSDIESIYLNLPREDIVINPLKMQEESNNSEPEIIQAPVQDTTPTQEEFTLPEISDDADWNFINIMQPIINELNRRGYNVKATSGVRKGARSKTAQGKPSRHSFGLAADLVTDDYKKLIDGIRQDKELQDIFDRYGIMLYDETSSDTLAVTKGTGPHIRMSINRPGGGYEFNSMKHVWLWNPQISLAKRGIKLPESFLPKQQNPEGDENNALYINELGVDTRNPYVKPGWDYMDGLPNDI